MTGEVSSRRAWLPLLLIAAGGLVLRLVPLLRAGGPLGAPVDYDEAVYFSASALFFKGILPYRDFVFVHPPGLVYFLGLTASLARGIDPARAFAAARIVAALVGAVNIVLAGRIAMRAAGPVGGLVAAALYATYPDVVIVERGPYLEPVLNLAALATALVWLAPRRRPALAGVLCAAACAVKLWGGIWLIAALATSRARSDAARFFGAAAAGLLLIAPFALVAPRKLVEQTLLFHAWRPPDGLLSKAERVPEIVGSGHLAASILAAVGIVVLIVRRRREERFFTIALLLTIAGFVASSSYWNQYNAHLAASECVLAGLGAAAIARKDSLPLAAAVAVIVALPSLWQALPAARAHSPELLAAGRTIRDLVPEGDCVFAFDPAWTLAGGRLPPHGDRAPVMVDSYGAMLLAAAKTGARFADAGHAFQSAAAQPEALERLRACRFAILGWRGNWQLSESSRVWFRQHYVCLTPAAGDLCLWERFGESQLGLAVVAPQQTIELGSGWYGEEGTPQTPWRWMGARSVTSLPPVSGPARLQLSLEFPPEGARNHQTVSVEIDGRFVDRFQPATSLETRSYQVDAGGNARHELVLSTDWTFNPARLHLSADTRDLGVRLNRIMWLEARRGAGAAATSSPR